MSRVRWTSCRPPFRPEAKITVARISVARVDAYQCLLARISRPPPGSDCTDLVLWSRDTELPFQARDAYRAQITFRPRILIRARTCRHIVFSISWRPDSILFGFLGDRPKGRHLIREASSALTLVRKGRRVRELLESTT